MPTYLGSKAILALRIAEAAEDPDEVAERQAHAFRLFKEKPVMRKLAELRERGYVEEDAHHFFGYRLTDKGARALAEHLPDPGQRPLVLDRPTLEAIGRHAGEVYPEECCGYLVEADSGQTWRVVECENVQPKLHQLRPDLFPKDGRTAYAMGPDDSKQIFQLAKQTPVVIYHSHVESPPVFSRDDVLKASHQGRPLFAGVDYLVLGISRQPDPTEGLPINRAAAYRWNAEIGGFLPIAIVLGSPRAQEVDTGARESLA